MAKEKVILKEVFDNHVAHDSVHLSQPDHQDSVRKTTGLWAKLPKMTLLKVSFSCILMGVILQNILNEQVWSMVYQFQWGSLIMATLLIKLSLVIAAKRWSFLLPKFALNFKKIFEIVMIGFFFNQCLPGSIGGDVYRVWNIKSISNLTLSQSVNSVFLDRFFGFLALGLVCLTAIPFQWDRIVGSKLFLPLISSIGIASFTILFFLALLAFKGYFNRFKFYTIILELGNLVKSNLNKPSLILQLGGTSIGVHLCLLACIYILAQDLNISIAPTQLLVVVPIVLFLSALPISFAGWGIREGAMVLALGAYGVSVEKALVLSLIYGILQIVASLPGFMLWLSRKQAA